MEAVQKEEGRGKMELYRWKEVKRRDEGGNVGSVKKQERKLEGKGGERRECGMRR